MTHGRIRAWAASIGLAGTILATGCGMIADKNRIKIAEIDGNAITRGDLYQVLYEMPDTDRPKIRNRGDLVRVLNDIIDRRIKEPLGDRLAAEGKITIPREAAREEFFRRAGDDAEQKRWMWNAEIPIDPATGQCSITPLMQTYNLDCDQLRASKDYIELETDFILRAMQADAAVGYLASEAVRSGKLTVDPARLEREYSVRKGELLKRERIVFRAIRLPAALGNASDEAARVRTRLDAGETFDAIFEDFYQRNPNLVTESEIENNPALEKFQSFWLAAAGASPGDILGPLYLPQYDQVRRGPDGKPQTVTQPDAYLVLKVLEHADAAPMSLGEAMPILSPPLLIAQMMDALRAERGVAIYEDKLPDPSTYGGQSSLGL